MNIKIIFISIVTMLLLSSIGSADPKFLACDCGDNTWCGSPGISSCNFIAFDAHHGCLHASSSSNTTTGCCFGFALGSPFKNYNFRGQLGNDVLGGATLRGHTGGSLRFAYTITDSLDITKNHVTDWWIAFTEIQSATIYYDEIGYSTPTISHISGNRYCDSTTILYVKDINDIYQQIDQIYAATYIFDIVDGYEYLIVFDAYNFYYFTADGSDIVRNYDNCEDQGDPGEPVAPDDPYNPNPPDTYIRLFFMDNCNNLLRNTSLQYCNHLGDVITCYFVDAPLGLYDLNFEDQEYLEIWVDSAIGTLYYNISNPKCAGFITYIILNPTISWNNNIMVVDGNTSGLIPISDALVIFSQDCIIDSTVYPSRNKFTDSNGFVNFEQCELDSFSVSVSANNYKSYSGSISSSVMNAFILSQTVMIKLYLIDDEGNESEYNYTDYNTNIYFKDIDGNYTTSIFDTDNYVDLYYYNNNSEGESMTLKFQKYSIETGIIDLLSWNIPIDTEGYKRILKSNYTDTSYLYIGYLYNYGIDSWDRTEYLNVRNETTEIDLDYQNLTAFIWFWNKNPEGSIDYREDIEIIAYANTTYVGLFVISLELYDNGEFITHINLTWADFISADLENYYEWNPIHSYVNGHNYTVRMHGYDYYLLDIDYINATDYRKNKLTILVKDNLGNNLVNSFIFLDEYGSLSTGSTYFNSYENLDDGYYRYRASKSGYTALGWDDITLSGSDETVTYILTSSTGEGSTQPIKASNNELRNLYIMLMSFLLIFILFGGFMYVVK